MTGGQEPRPAVDLDRVLDAVVALVEATVYEATVRRRDEIAVHSPFGTRPDAAAWELRNAAGDEEYEARTALEDLLDHERQRRLIGQLGAARRTGVRRGDAAYDALTGDQVDGVPAGERAAELADDDTDCVKELRMLENDTQGMAADADDDADDDVADDVDGL